MKKFDIGIKNPDNMLSVIESGNFLEITYQDYTNHKCNNLKLDKDSYINIGTGEIKDYNHTENRSQGVNSLLKTFSRLRNLINTNCTIPQNVLWVTLTYKENMTDHKRLYSDYDIFYKRFKRFHEKNDLKIPQYITVAEPQERGAWHLHCLFIYHQKAPYISNNTMALLWGQGFVRVNKLHNVDNVGAYLSAYLSDVPVSDLISGDNVVEKDIIIDGKKVQKKFIKGGRLALYPPGMNLYRHSKGIKEPKKYKIRSPALPDLIKDYENTYTTSFVIEDGNYKNRIEKKFYKRVTK